MRHATQPAAIHLTPIDTDTLSMTINGRPVPRPIRRRELGRLLSHMSDSHGRPVTVHYHDGDTVHLDLLTPPPSLTDPPTSLKDPRQTRQAAPAALAGFWPGERVHLAPVHCTPTADQDGCVHPPRLRRRDRHRPLLAVGVTSGHHHLHTPT
ncbi:hypothetical protein [Euzebya tangerina]|uniref:hypothetical protein n=1 Tax=Euzebya tangerina TaxID=591198 RepID=UPI000E31BAED|nr:hypothetical protein [Euzebya tangerina]